MFSQDWNAKPRRGRQRKVWSRLVDNLFGSLDKAECWCYSYRSYACSFVISNISFVR